MTRRHLKHSTAVASGLLDENGNPIPAATLDIRTLPEIDAAALPGLPDDMTAYLRSGDPPVILLYHPASDMHIEVPIPERHDLTPFVAAMRSAEVRQSMGEAPENDGYSFHVRTDE